MLPAATLGVPHNCPLHGPGAVTGPCCSRVFIGSSPAARMTDLVTCPSGPPAVIVGGNPTVLIGNLAAARQTDRTSHGGRIAKGCARVMIGAPAFDADGRLVKIPSECAFLNKGGTVEAPEPNFNASPATIGPGTSTTHRFPGDLLGRPAVEYPVDVRGHRIQVWMPADGDAAGKNLPSVQQIGNGLGGLSDEELDRVHDVEASPNRNPEDPYWAKQYGMPDFRADARAGDGTVTFFPESNGGNANVDSTMIHEAGHLYAQDSLEGRCEQRRLASRDERRPSIAIRVF